MGDKVKPSLANLQNVIIKACEANAECKEMEAQVKQMKAKASKAIEKAMGAVGKDEYTFKTIEHTRELENRDYRVATVYTCKKVQPQKVIFFVDEIEKNFDKEFCNEVIEKEYGITNMSGLVALLKKHGVSPAEFKQFVTVQKSVNTSRIDQLHELGEITAEDMQGCYEVVKQKARWNVNARTEGDKEQR